MFDSIVAQATEHIDVKRKWRVDQAKWWVDSSSFEPKSAASSHPKMRNNKIVSADTGKLE